MTQCGGQYYCPKNCSNVYNISELGDRLLFPPNFGWDNVMVRYFEDTSMNDMLIPIIAIDTFVLGLMWWDCRFNDRKQNLAVKYGSDYGKLKFGLLKELNKRTLAELGMILSPPAYIPSYITGRTNRYEGSLWTYWRY